MLRRGLRRQPKPLGLKPRCLWAPTFRIRLRSQEKGLLLVHLSRKMKVAKPGRTHDVNDGGDAAGGEGVVGRDPPEPHRQAQPHPRPQRKLPRAVMEQRRMWPPPPK